MERVTGVEPATLCLASIRSSQLSYTRIFPVAYSITRGLSTIHVLRADADEGKVERHSSTLRPARP